MNSAGAARPASSHLRASFALVLLVSAWMIFLNQGLVIGDSDDWDHVIGAHEASWRTLVTNFLTPWSRSENWSGYNDVTDQVLHRRIVLALLHKMTLSTLGFHPFPFYFVTKVLFFTALIVLLYFLLCRATDSQVFAFWGCAFFMLLPVHYMHLFWLSDTSVNAQVFILMGLFGYVWMLEASGEGGVRRSAIGACLLLMGGYLGMRTRDNAMILPVVAGIHALWNHAGWKGRRMTWLALMGILAFIVFQLVPVEHWRDAPRLPSQFRWESIQRLVWRNYANQYEDEPVSALFSTESVIPVSIARALGFFGLWTLFIYLAIYIWMLIVGRVPRPAGPVISLCLLWVLLEIFLMGFFLPEPRYYSSTMIPLTVLSVFVIHQVVRFFRPAWKKLLLLPPLFCFVWNSFVVNLSHIFFLRTLRDSSYHQMHEAAKTVYRDQFPNVPMTPAALAHYYCVHCSREPYAGPRIGPVLFHADIGLQDWNKAPGGHPQDFDRFARAGSPYALTFSRDPFAALANVSVLASIPGYREDSWFYRFYQRYKKKKPPVLYVLKWREES